jgi:hypothetical protein
MVSLPILFGYYTAPKDEDDLRNAFNHTIIR